MTTFDSPRTDAAARAPRRRIRIDLGATASVLVLVFFVVAAVAPALLATHSPTAQDFAHALQPPSLQFWFGTDEGGRDLYSRVVFGSRESLAIGVGAAGLAMVIALVLGTLAALGDRVTAAIVNRVLEVVFAFPTLLFSLLLVAILGPSAGTAILAVGVSTAPGYARMVRGQILSERNAGYVEAARALGHGRWRITRQHILPNAMRPLIAIFTMSIGQSIVWASGLAFLGLGVAPPSSEWGALLDAGRAYLLQAPWLTVIPGLVILVLALTATTVGRFIQNRLETGE
ncbi:ABC transporter permease [Microbacterium sp. cx-55]|uniref:ABC transporter permease n=1 Tax=unclassified Microbacterium TaxID=2609290 RepID=UPI001CC17E06|nr:MULTISPECIES: ABC transporter permease [unclassified Microbacterium]MBZ4487711.1 ABC transporter permease [Microbacterium sp. cx-55]MCC4908138.1 ABC transporter permease [Microbacterium sp. cx-59]UGB35722.1 ABC transporter permease [Microbacterium sp. cx-55]